MSWHWEGENIRWYGGNRAFGDSHDPGGAIPDSMDLEVASAIFVQTCNHISWTFYRCCSTGMFFLILALRCILNDFGCSALLHHKP
jgi:hypothetical protein